MPELPSPLTLLRDSLRTGVTTPTQVAHACIARANANESHNSYLHFDPQGLLAQARDLERRYPNADEGPPLYGVPVSLKDLFDLAGTVTTSGSRFYAERNPPATRDSALAERLKAAGALITGKTHLQTIAYGITGQNPAYGDCLQPRNRALLTGGSSSGAAASVQEGSAIAAIGTDTGGSIRVPAGLCGLTGYRASRALAYAAGPWPTSSEGLWEGAAHLAASFDTVGFFVRDPRDLAPIAQALFGLPAAPQPRAPRIAVIDASFLRDADPDILTAFRAFRDLLQPDATFTPVFWSDASEICAGIQASEAATLHGGNFSHFEPAIAQRLARGASLQASEVDTLRIRHARFRAQMAALFAEFDFLAVPSAPIARLFASEDQSQTRTRILRYTTPFSLAGTPVVTLPGELFGAPFGTGIQIAAPAAEDAGLLAFATVVAARSVAPQPES